MINIDVQGLEEAINRISHIPGAAEKAARQAVKDSLKGARRDAADKVRERYTVALSAVTKTIKIKATGGLSGEMTSRGGTTPLNKFFHQPKTPLKGQRGRFIFAQVVRAQGGLLAKGFIPKRGAGIYHQLTSSRYPIAPMQGPSAPGMLSVPEVSEVVQRGIERRIVSKLEHAANAILGGYF